MEQRRRDTLTLVPMLESAFAQGRMTDKDRFELMRSRIKDLLINRIQLLRIEAHTIQTDMEALMFRLNKEGSAAQLADVKTARWYRTASQVTVLQQLFDLSNRLAGKPNEVLFVPTEDEEEERVQSTDEGD